MTHDYDVEVIDAVRNSDPRPIVDAVWNTDETWSMGDPTQRAIVSKWSRATVEDAAELLARTEAWRKVAGRTNVTQDELDAVQERAAEACWRSLMESALDRLSEERERTEAKMWEIEREVYRLWLWRSK